MPWPAFAAIPKSADRAPCTKSGIACFVRIDWGAIVWASPACCAPNTAEIVRVVWALGSAENWRCVVFEKLRRVELLNGSWKTAPNHSRRATCVVDADIDAEDQVERDQNGQ
jgi:hypothetical protein